MKGVHIAMEMEHLLLTVTLLLTTVCSGHVLNKRREPTPMTMKMEDITKHLRDLTKSMAEFDEDLRQALDGSGCTGFRQDICQAMDILRERMDETTLADTYYPGKRSGEDASASKYRKMLEDLKQRHHLLKGLRGLFDKAGHILDREKRWFTCNLNLGFTCQTQEYSAIADYYDFLNSADSPGKRSVAAAKKDS